MARPQKVTDDQIREAQRIFAGEPDAIQRIAKYLRLNEKTVRMRLDRIEKRVAAPKAVAVVTQHESNVWDIRNGLQRNHECVERIIANVEAKGVVKLGAEGEYYTLDGVIQLAALLKENRAHYETAMKVAETLYRVEESKAFMEEVLAVLAEVDPTLRQEVLRRIAARRTVRAAFIQ